MSFRVIQPHNAPNTCFEKLDAETGKSLEFIQTDWDYAPLAVSMGWVPCDCGTTDGTVVCRCEKKRSVGEMLSEAYDFIRDHLDEIFEE